MQLVFNGTLDELKDTITTKAEEYNKDILIYHREPNTLEIGFQRLGHGGGRFFVAKVEETENNVILRGEISDIYSERQESKAYAFLTLLGAFAMFYAFIELVLLIIWLPILHFSHIWIPLLLPIPVLVYFRLRAMKEERKTDAEFIAFMSSFTAKYCPYMKEYIDEGCCYDLQMILDGYIKETALPDIKIDKSQLSAHCSRCRIKSTKVN